MESITLTQDELQAIKAEAWDEGYGTGNGHQPDSYTQDERDEENPYLDTEPTTVRPLTEEDHARLVASGVVIPRLPDAFESYPDAWFIHGNHINH